MSMRNEIEKKNREMMRDILIVCIVFVLLGIFLSALSGCTVSIGAEGRTYYPGENWTDPREGFFDRGGMDGMYTTPAPSSGFNTLGDN